MAGSIPREVAQLVRAIRRLQLWIVAVRHSQQLIDHEFVFATFDRDLFDRPRNDIRPRGREDILTDADRSAKVLVDAFQPSRDVYPVAHDGVAQPLARTDISDQHIRTMQADSKRKRQSSLGLPRIV